VNINGDFEKVMATCPLRAERGVDLNISPNARFPASNTLSLSMLRYPRSSTNNPFIIGRVMRSTTALKSLVKLIAEPLLTRIAGISTTSSAALPWRVRETLAQIEMAIRSLRHIKTRASFLPDARYVKQYQIPDCQRFGSIWQYWNSGADRAPPIIQECMASVRRHAKGRAIIVLSDDTLHKYITLPDHILAKRDKIGATQFSDVLRVSLLAQHGGTWIDASVLLTGGIDDITSAIPFFMFTRPNDPYMISSWFIHSVAGHPLVCAMRDLQTEYWAAHDEVRAYFMFHFLFECAITLHSGLRRIWKQTPTVFAKSPHLLQKALLARSKFERLQDICRRVRPAVHKLSYKFSEPVLAEAERIARWTRNL